LNYFCSTLKDDRLDRARMGGEEGRKTRVAVKRSL
jgi:hypothetical protein